MSSLLIKNMKKPNCYDCPMMKCKKCKGGQAYCVEIPTPHGRLIDADVAETAYPMLKYQLATIPTVIEAEANK